MRAVPWGFMTGKNVAFPLVLASCLASACSDGAQSVDGGDGDLLSSGGLSSAGAAASGGDGSGGVASGGVFGSGGDVGTGAGEDSGGAVEPEMSGGTAGTGGSGSSGGSPSNSGGSPPNTGGSPTGDVGGRSSGCDEAGPLLAEGLHEFSLDGANRRYTVRLPETYDHSRAWPVVLALHPNGGAVGYWDGTGGSRNIRGHLKDDAIVIIAEAMGGNWRDYGAPESEWPARVELELAYFDRVLSDAKTQLCLDEGALFAVGFSGGGSFSGVLGCRRRDVRAFASGGSVVYFDPDDCVGDAAAWIALSDGDETVDRQAFRDFFVERAGCEGAPPADFSCVEYSECAPESPVVYCRYPGGHDWPEFGVEEAWSFFSRFVGN